ncbi:hypothetical protein [Paraglaciecola sp. 2405UD69-4]|uniref:hypothetical protein n=1 Tax=Paraglaciecola sp. 2405UD69-4 TaxID=3391836 RepID=UPI0039C9DCB2
MLKNLFLAVLIGAVLAYCFGHVATEWFDMHLVLSDYELEPLTSILAATGVVVLLVLVGFVVAFSVVAAIALVLIVSVLGVFAAGIGMFWPVILVSIIIYLLVRDRPSSAY